MLGDYCTFHERLFTIDWSVETSADSVTLQREFPSETTSTFRQMTQTYNRNRPPIRQSPPIKTGSLSNP